MSSRTRVYAPPKKKEIGAFATVNLSGPTYVTIDQAYMERHTGAKLAWISFTNYGYLDFVCNFIAYGSLKFDFLLVCSDEATYKEAKRLGVPYCARLHSPNRYSSQSTSWGSEHYKQIVFSKINVLQACMKEFVKVGIQSIGYIDTDIVLLKNPTPYIESLLDAHPEVSVFSQCDEVGMQCSALNGCRNPCSGVLVLRTSIDPLTMVYTRSDMEKYDGDQNFLRDALMIKRSILWRTLPRDLFLNGASMGFPGNPVRLPHFENAYLMHFNYLDGSNRKRNAMRAWNCWVYKSDYTFTLSDWQQRIKDEREWIVQASEKAGGDKWQPFPIGFGYQFTAYKHLLAQSSTRRPHLVVSAFDLYTDKNRRPKGINRQAIASTLRRNGISTQTLNPKQYFEFLLTHKFVVSPEGNGIDCHRHYEALMFGCIPIVERNAQIEEKYRGCPILYTTDYSEITPDYLERKYEEMMTVVYDFRVLMISNYPESVQQTIKDCGNYWMYKINKKNWYMN